MSLNRLEIWMLSTFAALLAESVLPGLGRIDMQEIYFYEQTLVQPKIVRLKWILSRIIRLLRRSFL